MSTLDKISRMQYTQRQDPCMSGGREGGMDVGREDKEGGQKGGMIGEAQREELKEI